MTAEHDPLAPLQFLVGTWRGRGHGDYPTISPFDYVEEITIARMPKPVLRYEQRTRHADTDEPLHAELGFLRIAEGLPELIVAQPTGIAEVHRGTVDGHAVSFTSTGVALTDGASSHRVTAVERRIAVDGRHLRYELHMAAVGQPLQLHLSAELTRQ